MRVHGLSALLVPLLPVVEEAKLVQAGEQRIYITLEGADSKALVNLLTLLYTGRLEPEYKIGVKYIKVHDVSFRDIRSGRGGQTSPLGNEQNA